MAASSSSWLSRVRRFLPGARIVPRATKQAVSRRINFEVLEDRLAPAFDLTINAAATNPTLISSTFNSGTNTTTFEAIATTAHLNVDDIRLELALGRNVQVTTGTAGAEAGNIAWTVGNLDVNAISIASLSLALLPDASSTTGSVSVGADIFDSMPGDGDFINVIIQSAAGGGVSMAGSNLTAVQNVTINAGTNPITLGNVNSTGSQTYTGSTITVGGATHTSFGDQTYIGNVVLPSDRMLTSTNFNITFIGSINGTSADTLALNAPNGTVSLQTVGGSGQIADLDVVAISTLVTGDITLVDAVNPQQLSFTGFVGTSGTRMFNLAGVAAGSSVLFQDGDTNLGGDLTVLLANPTDTVTIDNGTFNAQGNTVTTNGVFTVGDGGQAATYAGTGTLNAAIVEVINLGRIAPGGNGGPGNLAITATNVNFQTGSFLDIDLQGPDQLNVTGTVNLGSNIAFLDGDGTLPSVSPSTILTATTLITGTFTGTGNPLQPFVLGEDAVTATYSPTMLQITQAPAGPNTVTGLTSNGDKYTIKKTGPGQLIVIDIAGDPGIEGIVIRGSASTTALTITVTPNGGPGIETIEALRVDGNIGTVTAKTSDFNGDHRVSGLLGTLKVRDLFVSLTGGGTATQKTTITGRSFGANITLTSKLNKLSVNQYTGGAIHVPTIGTITTTANPAAFLTGIFATNLVLDAGSSTATALSKATIAGFVSSVWDVRGKIGTVTVKGSGFGWTLGTTGSSFQHPDQLGSITKVAISALMNGGAVNSIGRINTLTAGDWFGCPVTAQSIGTFKLTRNTALGTSGAFSGSNVTITGFVNPGRVALKTFSATGAVQGSTFDVQAGNVTSFTASKFLSSNLYVGYTPAANISTPGTFTGNFKISTFKTTATPLVPGMSDPATDGFQDSEVASSRVGTVRLSGVNVNNSGTTFGFRVAAVAGNVGSFQIATNPFTAGVNYTPSGTGAVTPVVIGQMDFGFFV